LLRQKDGGLYLTLQEMLDNRQITHFSNSACIILPVGGKVAKPLVGVNVACARAGRCVDSIKHESRTTLKLPLVVGGQ